jgi:hypothetical protein
MSVSRQQRPCHASSQPLGYARGHDIAILDLLFPCSHKNVVNRHAKLVQKVPFPGTPKREAHQSNQFSEIGVGLTTFGALFMMLGIMLFFDGALLALGNVRAFPSSPLSYPQSRAIIDLR